MNPKLQKVSFYVILVLLVVFVPLSGFGMYYHFTHEEKIAALENINKDFFFDGKLWFYNAKGELLGTYKCEHEYCGYASSSLTDNEYGLDYYIASNEEEETHLPIIHDRFVFLRDTEEEKNNAIFLFDIKNNQDFKSLMYASVKNYQVGLKDNLFIVENQEHHFGVLEINDVALLKIPTTYDFLGVVNLGMEDEKLIADYFVGLKDGEWMILDQNEAKLTNGITENIKTFNGEYIITKMGELNHRIIDYDNNPILEEDFSNLFFVGRYLACQTISEFYIYDLLNQKVISETHKIFQRDVVDASINEENKIILKVNDVIVETIEP